MLARGSLNVGLEVSGSMSGNLPGKRFSDRYRHIHSCNGTDFIDMAALSAGSVLVFCKGEPDEGYGFQCAHRERTD